MPCCHLLLPLLLLAQPEEGASEPAPAADPANPTETAEPAAVADEAAAESSTAPVVLPKKTVKKKARDDGARRLDDDLRWIRKARARRGAITGFVVGAVPSAILTFAAMGSTSEGNVLFPRQAVLAAGTMLGTIFTGLSTLTGALIGYHRKPGSIDRSPSAQAGRPGLAGYVDRSPPAPPTGKLGRYGGLQLLVLLPYAVISFSSLASWRGRERVTLPAQNFILSTPTPVSASLSLSGGGPNYASLMLLGLSASSAMIFHWGRPVDRNGDRRSSWGETALLATGSLVAGMVVPIANKRHYQDEQVPDDVHDSIWVRATTFALAGLLVTDGILAAVSSR